MADPGPSTQASLPFDAAPLDGIAGPVIVALSGGLDSTTLLHTLAKSDAIRARGLEALHVHHGLHVDADRWAGHCATLCASLGVALHVERVHVDGRGLGREGAAREARHAAFARQLQRGGVLALAHHLDDQAETFLLRALRGSGPDGLGAMRALRRLGNGWLWRPLLALPRTRLRAYARAHALAWVEDPGNADTTLDRNFLRHRVMPLLRERWPHADTVLGRSAGLSAEASDLLDRHDAVALSALACADPAMIDVSGLRALVAPQRARVLRLWVARLGLPPPPARALSRIAGELLHTRPDSLAEVAWQGVVVRAWRGRLHAARDVPLPPRGWQADWDGRAPLALPDGGRLEARPAMAWAHPVVVRLRRGGERIRLPGRAHGHSLKHALQDAGVPPWQRLRIPLLVAPDGEVLAAGDRVVGSRMAQWLQPHGAQLYWCPGDAASGD